MWEEQYERMAMNGEPMPDELTLPYQLYYQTLVILYRRYRLGEIDKDRASQEKSLARYRTKSAHDILERARSSSERYAKMNIRIERAANAYARNRTLENADRLYKALYGMEPTKKEET